MKLIVISAVWCPSCLILNKQIKNIKEEFDIEIEKLDYDLDEDKIEMYNIGKTVPVLILEKDNKEIKRLTGEKSYNEIKEFLNEEV